MLADSTMAAEPDLTLFLLWRGIGLSILLWYQLQCGAGQLGVELLRTGMKG